MKTVLKGIRIGGVASALPTKWLSLEEQFGNKDETEAKTIRKFTKNTGVSGRYLAGPRQTSADLCYAAAEKLLAEKNIDKTKVGVLVFVSQTEDYRSPASAAVLQFRLGLGQECMAFDVNLGCSGFTCGLGIAGSMLMQSDLDYALLLCGDTSAREKNPAEETFSSNSDKMLFGDSGTATLLQKDPGAKDITVLSATDGSGFKSIIVPYEWYRNPKMGKDTGVLMDGVAVFDFSTTKAPEMICSLMEQMGCDSDDYDCLVLHQANKMIMDRIAKSTGFSNEKNIRSIDTYGNTSSGSIPNTLAYHYGKESEGIIHCIMCGYGVGLSWSAADCYISKADVIPPIFTDEYFEDGYHVE